MSVSILDILQHKPIVQVLVEHLDMWENTSLLRRSCRSLFMGRSNFSGKIQNYKTNKI